MSNRMSSFSLQVDSNHYLTKKYLSTSRFLGLQAQLSYCRDAFTSDAKIIEIGPGPGLLTAILRHLGYWVVTMDIDPDLSPDILGSLPNIPLSNQSMDFCCAFEVLEHLPITLLIPCLIEMKRVARKGVLLSLPNQKELFESKWYMEVGVGRKKWTINLYKRGLNRLTNSNEHYWEIGHNTVTVDTIISAASSAGLHLVKTEFHSPWFQLFSFSVEND